MALHKSQTEYNPPAGPSSANMPKTGKSEKKSTAEKAAGKMSNKKKTKRTKR